MFGNAPKKSIVPRIRFELKLPFYESFVISRLQFPLRLAYSMTLNKSQGQTLNKVLIDITKPPFSHGHLYVGLSRVTHYSNILLYVSPENILDEEYVVVSNVVYPEIIQHA